MDDNTSHILTGPRLTIRKSVFVATVFSVCTEMEARRIVKDRRKKDRKARHIAFAFRIDGEPVAEGMSDNGEPRGTAGLSVLIILRNRELRNILVTVTRYWGGIKLGPGNLRRAYSHAAQQALDELDRSEDTTN